MRPRPQTISKIHDIFPRRWSEKPPKSDNIPHLSVKKILIYYPRNIKSVKSFTSQIHQEVSLKRCNPRREKLFKQILSRYKPEVMRFQDINLSYCSHTAFKVLKAVNLLSISLSKFEHRFFFLSLLCKVLRVNAKLRTLEICDGDTCLPNILRTMRYVNCLESIYIHNLSVSSLKELKENIFASSRSLKKVTLTGFLTCQIKPRDLFRTVCELPNLKRFNFDAGILGHFDINQIPFNIFQKRDISYDIRIAANDERSLNIPSSTEMGLLSVDFLGINFKRFWQEPQSKLTKLRNTLFQEQYVKAQETCSKVLIITLSDKAHNNLSPLLHVCKNIVTLDVTVSMNKFYKKISFAGLKYLSNLKQVFVSLDSIEDNPSQVFSPLTYCLPNSKLFNNLALSGHKLKSFTLCLNRVIFHENRNPLERLFQACSDTLERLTIFDDQKLEYLYEGLIFLRKLDTLILHSNCHPINTARILRSCENLKKFYLCCYSGSMNGLHDGLLKLPKLETLGLHLNGLSSSCGFLQEAPSKYLTNLKHLELAVGVKDKKEWNRLLKTLQRFPSLQRIKIWIKFWMECDKESAKLDLEILVKNNPKFKFVSFPL